MGRDKRSGGGVHLVGSLPFESAEEALRRCGEGLAGVISSLPDGETGERKMWINYLPERIYSRHPDLEETHRPDPSVFNEPEHSDPDSPPAMDDLGAHWLFRIKEGTGDLRFDLGYADFALESYAVLERLRAEGSIATDISFQVCLPATMSAVDCYFEDAGQWPVAYAAYRDAILSDIDEILGRMPAADLVVQFDVAEEVVDLALGDRPYHPYSPRRTFDEKFASHIKLLTELGERVPGDVRLGYHWCYGTWGGWPMIAMRDLRLCVDLSNSLISQIARHVDYVHMPVARTSDLAFYAPLNDLDIGDTRVYLGMIHHEDGVSGFASRMEAARRYLRDFGIGAVCGYGRSDPDEVGDVVALHRECAAMLAA